MWMNTISVLTNRWQSQIAISQWHHLPSHWATSWSRRETFVSSIEWRNVVMFCRSNVKPSLQIKQKAFGGEIKKKCYIFYESRPFLVNSLWLQLKLHRKMVVIVIIYTARVMESTANETISKIVHWISEECWNEIGRGIFMLLQMVIACRRRTVKFSL